MKRGRPEVAIGLTQLFKLSKLHCTNAELADFFGCSEQTIISRRKQPDFKRAMEQGRAHGKINLRRAQMKDALKGNTTLLKWLGMQILDQRELSGPLEVTSNRLDEIVKALTCPLPDGK